MEADKNKVPDTTPNPNPKKICLLVIPSMAEAYNNLRTFAAMNPPFGLMCIAAVVENMGYDVQIIDGDAEGLGFEQMLDQLEEIQPSYVGSTCMTATMDLTASLRDDDAGGSELHGISARFWCYLIFGKQAIFDQFEDHERLLEAFRKRDQKTARQVAVDHIQKFVNQVKDHVLI